MVCNLWTPISQNISQCVLLNLVNYRSIPGLGEVLFSGAVDPPWYVLKKTSGSWSPLRSQPPRVIPSFLVIPSHINIQYRAETFCFYKPITTVFIALPFNVFLGLAWLILRMGLLNCF